ncbi:bifunctional molybdenum cofactor biosynthesis protein MoaC/MoaB [Spongiivirga citrea]|uniref:Molybdopterin adenylyltransferase n=1 Tax=Spongiivirga citrea TaxID=1481457 RepID=A0A6M0CHP1_9FLAO|nr:bifunctional molybdenum cofactor biosynthesis protein MoaC/MoaB [Spongiivirga citrea]NER17468.1 bifunctional molybdenum cofactor biosynthesis protein MoaC/MoaB [Spongiivirga citrea]
MVDITHKNTTLRTATAKAIVKVSKAETITAIQNKTVPKGDVFAMSKAAGLLGVKKTSDLLPDCHPMPIEHTSIDFEIKDLEISIIVSVKTIYKTGVEVEAMHGASVVAVNMYDMLKPIDKEIEIHHIKLDNKEGGKSTYKNKFGSSVKAAVIVSSDAVFEGRKPDSAGEAVKEKLEACNVNIIDYVTIPNSEEMVQEKAKHYQKEGADLIIFTGGTGLSEQDNTPESLAQILDRTVPGMEEAIRKYGQDRTPYAMLSRSLVGTIKNTLVMALPGSTNGASESMDALFPAVLHVFKTLKRNAS